MINRKLVSQCQKAGLPEKEAQIYAALLELGGGYPSTLANYAHINRSSSYKLLLNLSVKGLVQEIRKGRKLYYQIDKPEKLEKYSKSLMTQAQNYHSHAQSIIPDLQEIVTSAKNKTGVTYYEGAEGIREVLNELVSIEESYELTAFSNIPTFQKVISKKEYQNFVQKKVLKGITTRAILPEHDQSRSFTPTHYSYVPKKLRPNLKYIDPKLFPFEGEIGLFDTNKIYILNYIENEYNGIIIDDHVIYGIIKMAFDIAWNSSVVTE